MILVGSIASAVMSGCVVTGEVHERRPVYYEERPAYVAPQPVYVQPQPVYVQPQPTQVVVVRRPVPAPLVEAVPARPGPDFVWVGGYWEPRGDDWAWHRGGWSRPPRSGAVWVEPRHENRGDHVEFSLGFWR